MIRLAQFSQIIFSQLLRDLMSVDPDDELVRQWRSLNHLLVLNLLSERSSNLRHYSAKLMPQVDAWCEAHSTQTPLLFRKGIWGQPGNSRVSELLGSLGLQAPKAGKEAEEWAHRTGYLAMFRSMVLWERSQGVRVEEVERQFGVQGLEGIEKRWRDELLWLLAGLAKLLDVRTFYYHLKENCEADFRRIKRVKQALEQMKQQIYNLQEQLKYCSPLGILLCEMRRVSPYKRSKVGIQSIRRLEEAGIESIKDLAHLRTEDLVKLGVQRKIAEQVRGYIRANAYVS
ncbi:MAG: helix-hairpin-helix domain-containing protein [Phormidesmis sp. CAN_BIN44]|nr:helix-hairpin-helix domain-containing protein [Phormidesmis sp. CAN_BIN44]